jgi:hypothetical protein
MKKSGIRPKSTWPAFFRILAAGVNPLSSRRLHLEIMPLLGRAFSLDTSSIAQPQCGRWIPLF